MHSIQSYLVSVVTGAIVSFGASGAVFAEVMPNPLPSPATASDIEQDTVELTVYRPDLFCETLLPETVEVPRSNPLEGAVGHVLKDWARGEFRIAGYRTSRDAVTGTVTVDLRVAPDAPRQWTSLSTCEQFALFGSLRSTLTQNPRLQTQTVEFVSQGEPLAF
ncbi:hypothetical protein CKA32_005661 [Geitlerinema sp. FC II]|uniref:hypothetical protein n=1 Tax=Baaleninema simplex TaxID=2862350 RepID=UPI0003497185|nr:hypothetical protein [Baaleninema simplex]MDC0831721.1 sporulation/spore germination protein [Geitlerinema sp. CS-897]PPT05432.1 hypothetical protein CKA32_005661 [Geitlerinema sp. FC II]